MPQPGRRDDKTVGIGGWILIAFGVLAVLGVTAALCWLAWRRTDSETRSLVRRIGRLPLGRKFRLAFRLARDPRVPVAARAVPVLLVFYLAMPIDIIPDFIPVVGHLDDVLIVLVAGGILLRLVPRNIVEDMVAELETPEREEVRV